MMFFKGFVTSIVCGTIGYLVALNGTDTSNLSIGAALLGGVVYMIGYVHGEDKGKGLTDQEKGMNTLESQSVDGHGDAHGPVEIG